MVRNVGCAFPKSILKLTVINTYCKLRYNIKKEVAMLELKHLTKVYRTKGGNETRALDDVSVSFGGTGLVFLLGKSGSGKSTLLNLAGGLDEPTSGEVIVMGKSSRDFSGSDFDSYRNTFIGFVFQEYNVLNEFNVEDNVALALELQGKTREKEKVRSILEEVELGAYAKRKPNTLSGGQKQRIAIARALVKDPQIIMADEPTGALDSATGKQVFDTLKQLSKTRLVIVVSHDREFAEQYGDRLIELKDGKIISDMIKVEEAPKALEGNLTKIGENVLTIRKGRPDRSTILAIEKFIEGSDGDVILSRGEAENASFRRANHITEGGAIERFDNTDEEALDIKKYEGEKTKFIRSRLPAGKAIKIGASGLKLKPIRLIFTILLSVVSFIMFGLFSTMMLYDGDSVLINSFMQSDYEYLSLNKQYEVTVTYSENDYSYVTYRNAKFTPAEVAALGGADAFGTYSVNLNSFRNVIFGIDRSEYYNPNITKVGVLPANHALRGKINGKYPAKADEICISSYVLECLKNAEFYPVDGNGDISRTAKPIRSASDLIGEQLSTYNGNFTVVGVFDSGSIPAKYDELKEASAQNNYMLYWEFQNYITEGLHSLALADESFVDTYQDGYDEYVQHFDSSNNNYIIFSQYDSDSQLYNTSSVKVYESEPSTVQFPIVRLDGGRTALKDNQLIPSLRFVYSYFYEQYSKEANALYEQQPQYENYSDEDIFWAEWESWNTQYQQIQESFGPFDIACNAIMNGEYWDPETGEMHETAESEVAAFLQTIINYIQTPFTVPLYSQNYMSSAYSGLGDYEIVGFYYTLSGQYSYEYGYYCSQSFYDRAGVYSNSYTETTKYVQEEDATFGSVFVPLEKSSSALRAFFDKLLVTNPETDVVYGIDNFLFTSVVMVNELIGDLSLIFLIIGIVLAVFSALLLFNFISMSISNKRKEIGILRAVGARGTDVFKIFLSESGIIVGICTLLALVGTIVLTYVINNLLKAEAGLGVTLFVFGPLSILLMIAIAVVVAVVSTFLPVYFAARKKPVESIRAL